MTTLGNFTCYYLDMARKENLKEETESLLISAQNNAISTDNVIAKIDNTQIIAGRPSGDRDKTVNHIIIQQTDTKGTQE